MKFLKLINDRNRMKLIKCSSLLMDCKVRVFLRLNRRQIETFDKLKEDSDFRSKLKPLNADMKPEDNCTVRKLTIPSLS